MLLFGRDCAACTNQVDLLRQGSVDFRYDYFGGEESFSNMLATAKENAAAR